jgi:hypothetical protein
MEYFNNRFPFSTLFAIPTSIALQFKNSQALASCNGLEVSFAPTLSNNTKFDLSAATAYTVTIDNGVPQYLPYFYESQGIVNTLITATFILRSPRHTRSRL